MTLLHLPTLLRLSRPLALLLALGALITALVFIGMSIDVATDGPEVQLVLDKNSPNMFSALHELQSGWEAGFNSAPRPDRARLLPVLPAGFTGFEVVADAQAPVLRYPEPSAGKRLALLLLGASSGYLSLAFLVYLFVGSWLLWLLLLDVTPATPFTIANARRLRGLGLLVLGLDFGQELAYLALRALVPAFRTPDLAEPLSHYARFSTENTLPGWEVGLVLLIIAAVYQRGVELSREAELVI